MSPRLSVVICSRDGAAGVGRCLRALAAQTIRPALEVIVVDDGSADGTGDVARGHGAIVLRHETSRGPAAARNTGARVASAPILAFLDDDCEPEPGWAEQAAAAFHDDVIGVAGAVLAGGRPGFMLGYLARHNPLEPQELSLARSSLALVPAVPVPGAAVGSATAPRPAGHLLLRGGQHVGPE